jgi:hypothetical protein
MMINFSSFNVGYIFAAFYGANGQNVKRDSLMIIVW